MSIKALLEMFPDERRKLIFHTEDGVSRIETRQDVEPIIKIAGALSEEKPGKDFRRVALIPLAILNQAMIEGWANDEKQWRKWANDADNQCFRTWQGKL